MSFVRPVLLALALLAAPPATRAADPTPAPEVGVTAGPCRADTERLCGDVPAGGGARARCLREKRDQVSAECRAQLEPAQRERNPGRLAEVQAACHDDAEKLCADVRPGGGAILRCLRDHPETSAGCRAAMSPPAP
jgi:hypothetical protein